MFELSCWLLSLLMVIESGSAQSIINPPSKVTGKVGGAVQFNCQVHLDAYNIQWHFGTTIIYSYTNGAVDYPHNRYKDYRVTESGLNFTLTIPNLTFSDAGKYFCAVETEKKSAWLTVLGMPEITASALTPVDGDEVVYKCQACFSGPKRQEAALDYCPQLMMSMGNGSSKGTSNDTELLRGNTLCLVKVFTIVVNGSMNGERLECSLTSPLHKMSVVSDTVVSVLYPVKNIRYIPKLEQYEVGNRITCLADGNPQPLIQWETTSKEKKSVEGLWLNITEEMIGDNSWKCTAWNFVRQKLYKTEINVDFVVLDNASENCNDVKIWKTTAISVIIILTFMILGLLIYVLIHCKKTRYFQLPNLTTYESNQKIIQVSRVHPEVII